MGNYFSISSSETKESIKIINEIDHIHVIASGSEISSNDFLNEQTQEQAEIESNVDVVAENQTQLGVSQLPDCIVYKKTNMKKKKCKKNKKKHLQ
jgi:hypothetical protein